jgi:hypothetical protein
MLSRLRTLTAVVFITASMLGLASRASALPIFSHEYGVTCQKCHTAIPSLNTFGKAFLDNGYHIMGSNVPPVFPVSLKANLLYSSNPDPGMPKAVVDEIEVLTAGTVGSRGNYFIEQYAVDGGDHGNLREAWYNEHLSSGAGLPVDLRVGQFTLPVPIDPESFRESYNDYAVFVQTVGANPFDFFHTKPGLSMRLGSYDRGLDLELSAFNGHDVQSGLPTNGLDLMQTVHELFGPFDLSAYHYAGHRDVTAPLAGPGLMYGNDQFSRSGFGLRFAYGRWTSESVLQENEDTNVDGFGRAAHSSGGFTQLRYAITKKWFGLVRYDGTNAPFISDNDFDGDSGGFFRSTTALLGYRLSHNTRFTIEDVMSHYRFVPANTLNTQFTVAY